MAFDIEIVYDDEEFCKGEFLARCGKCGRVVGKGERKWLFYRMQYWCTKCIKESKK